MRFPGLLLALILMLNGCASKTTHRLDRSNYVLGKDSIAFVGIPFLSEERGSAEENQHWEGILFGGMHHSYAKNDDYVKSEMLYGGANDRIVNILYREIHGNDTMPMIQHPYLLDLNNGPKFQLEGYTIEVISADPTTMKYRILQSPWIRSS